MKKVLSIALVLLMLVSAFALAGCGAEKTLKFGMGIYTAIEKSSSAEGDTNGEGQVTATVAAVLVDENGKIVKCAIDTADNKVAYTSEGKYVKANEFKTKYELKESYNMKTYGGSAKEWYEQADAFAGVVVGKTVDEVKALLATNGKGTDDVINAGCTIAISDFVKAVEKAMANVADSNATKDSALKLGIVSTQTGLKDATEEADGVNEVDVTVVAAALDAEKKVVAIKTDAVVAKFTFDIKGASTFGDKKTLTSKLEDGDNYNMAKYGTDLNNDGVVKEWYVQADAFNAACVGKDAAGIAALALDTGYGVDSLQTSGCTINVADMVKAANKAAN